KTISRLRFRRLGSQTAQFAISQIDPVHFTLLAFRVKRVAISWIEQDIETVTTRKRGPITVANALLTLHAARSHPIFVVLKATRNSEIRFRVVERDPIKFSCGNLVQMIPIFAARKTLIHAAISPEQQTLANWRFRRLVFVFGFWWFWWRHCAGLNRERVAIRMNFFREILTKVFAAVIGHQQREAEKINALVVCRVDAYLAKIKRARVHGTRAWPFFASVFRPKNPARLAP